MATSRAGSHRREAVWQVDVASWRATADAGSIGLGRLVRVVSEGKQHLCELAFDFDGFGCQLRPACRDGGDLKDKTCLASSGRSTCGRRRAGRRHAA